jgi:RNA polymerase sigma factor (sigma-70 family)
VEDCIQELFIDLWRRKAQLADAKKIDYYLMKALRWKIMRAYQQQSKRASETERYNTESLVTVSFPFESVLIEGQEASEKSLKIKEAIDSLSPKQKEVIHLLFFQKYSYEEVSDTMSMNIRSVYTLAWKAISTLRRYLLLFFTCTWMMSL